MTTQGKTIAGDRRIEIVCETPTQKVLLEAKARAAGRSLSRYVLRRALGLEEDETDGTIRPSAERFAAMRQELADTMGRLKEATGKLAVQERLDRLRAAQLPVGMAISPEVVAQPSLLDAYIIRAIMPLQDVGEPVSVTAQDVATALGRSTPTPFLEALVQERLERMAARMLVERVRLGSETAYAWVGIP